MAEIYQMLQLKDANGGPSGKWQNTVRFDESDSEPIAVGPVCDSPTEAQEWLWLNGPSDLRRINVKVNGRSHWLVAGSMSYEDIRDLAGQTGNPSMTYHVRLDSDTVRQGTLIPGESVRLAHGMRINVVHTNNA